MKRNSDTWAVYTANARRSKIDTSPPYQRGLVWSRNQKQMFIDSLIRNFDIPKLYFRRIADTNSPYEWEIVDGQQRMNAIWEFLNDEYPMSRDSDPVGELEISSKVSKNLPNEVQDQLLAYQLDIVEIYESEDQEIEEMFIRLQNGVPLNSAEKRNAISGELRDFVNDISSSNSFMTNSIAISNNRYAHHEVVAQMLLIEMNGGPTAITPAKLRTMYETNSRFSERSGHATKLKRVLNFLAQAFPQRTPELTRFC